MSRLPGDAELPHYVYRLLDEDGHTLYIGCSKNVSHRVRQWAGSSEPWTWCIRGVCVTEYPDRRTATTAEYAAIKSGHPLWNMLGHYKRGDFTPRELLIIDINHAYRRLAQYDADERRWAELHAERVAG